MIALDILLLIMIIICIVYCWILNRRIQDLHNSRVEFARMIKEFDAAILKADRAISDMTTLSSKNGEQLTAIQDALKNGEHTHTELKMVTDVATNVAERLEKNISIARKLDKIAEMSNEANTDAETLKEAVETAEQVMSKDSEDIEQRTMSPDEAIALHHKNELEAALKRIVQGSFETTNLNQAGYYDTLRRISARK